MTSSPPAAAVPLAVSRRPTTPLSLALPSGTQMCQSLTTFQLYVDSLSTVLQMVRQAIVSGTVALATNALFTQGLFWLGKSPAAQTYAEFLVATMTYVSFFIAIAMLVGHSAPLTKFHHVDRPNAPSGPAWFWLWRVFRTSRVHYVTSLLLVAAIAYAGATLDKAWRPYQLHFYAAGLVINYYTAAIDVAARMVFQTETVEGRALGYVNRAPFWQRLAMAYRQDFGFVIAVFVASAYIHISSRLSLESQEGLVVFSVASMGFRIATMSLTRRFVLRLHKVHVRTLYVVATVPTVLINTQVRVALLRVKANVSMTGVIVLALIEPCMRFFKVWATRQEIRQKASSSSSPSPFVSRVPSSRRIVLLPSASAAAQRPHGQPRSTPRAVAVLPVAPVLRRVQAARTKPVSASAAGVQRK